MAATEIILSAEEIAALPREPLTSGIHGVQHAVLWCHNDADAGIMYVAPSYAMPSHRHRSMAHHIWIISGRARVEGRILTAGSYCYAPAGVVHALEGLAPEGCTVFYLYEPPLPSQDQRAGEPLSVGRART